MRVVLKHHIKPIKSGFAAECSAPRLVAHGLTPEMARRNLERVALSLFAPFERDGTLEDEMRFAGVAAEDDGGELSVEVTD